jgi:hypothetical protein
MLQSVTYCQDEAPDGTGFNDPPVNLKPMTEMEFAQSAFHGGHIASIEYRQMLLKPDLSPGKAAGGKLLTAKLFWFDDDTGVAISADYWAGKVSYFSFGCAHSFEKKTFKAGEKPHCNLCNTDVHEPWMDLLVDDTGWDFDSFTSISIRGIRDYRRAMEFTRVLDDKELKKLVKFLQRVDCPGWTGVGLMRQVGNVYKFTTTHDSSD